MSETNRERPARPIIVVAPLLRAVLDGAVDEADLGQ